MRAPYYSPLRLVPTQVLIDTAALDLPPERASALLLDKGRIAATAMIGWGAPDQAGRYLRLVFANEPRARLAGIRERFRAAWGM